MAEQPTDKAAARAGGGPAEDGEHTPKILWAAVLMMCAGAALLCAALISFGYNKSLALVFVLVGVVVGLIGSVIALRGRIMSNTS